MNLDKIVPYLKFTIQHPNSKELFLIDTSNWLHLTQCNAYYEISMPGGGKKIQLDVRRDTIQVLNSNRLDITSIRSISDLAELPDGIWTIKIYIPNTEFSATFNTIRTNVLMDKIKCKVSEMSRKQIEDNSKILSNILSYELASISNAENCNIEEAMYMYEMMEFNYKKL